MSAEESLTRWKASQRAMIVFAMTATQGNKSHAAKWLGISVRSLRSKYLLFKIHPHEHTSKLSCVPPDSGVSLLAQGKGIQHGHCKGSDQSTRA